MHMVRMALRLSVMMCGVCVTVRHLSGSPLAACCAVLVLGAPLIALHLVSLSECLFNEIGRVHHHVFRGAVLTLSAHSACKHAGDSLAKLRGKGESERSRSEN